MRLPSMASAYSQLTGAVRELSLSYRNGMSFVTRTVPGAIAGALHTS